jgi:hypothetical protein
MPSLALVALAAWRFPNATLQISIDADNRQVLMRYRKRDAARGELRWETQVDTVQLLDVHTVGSAALTSRDFVLMADDVAAHARIPRVNPHDWQSRTHSYVAVMNASDATLRAWFDEKAVMVGGTLPNVDEKTRRDGTRFHGVFFHAAVLENLINNIERQRPDVGSLRAFALLWAALAGLIVSLQPPRRWRGMRGVGLLCGGVAVLAACSALMGGKWSTSIWFVPTTVAVTTLAFCGALCTWAKAAREYQLQLSPSQVRWGRASDEPPTTMLAGPDSSHRGAGAAT